MTSADHNENPNVVGKGRKQEVRVCLPHTMGISLDDNTALQKYLDLVDWYSGCFPSGDQTASEHEVAHYLWCKRTEPEAAWGNTRIL